MISNPQTLNMLLDSPQVKPLLDANPQLRTMFENPQMMQMLLNPQMLQNAMSMMGSSGLGGLGTNLSGGSTFNVDPTHGNSTEPNNIETSENSTNPNNNTTTTNTNTTPNTQQPFNPFMFGFNNMGTTGTSGATGTGTQPVFNPFMFSNIYSLILGNMNSNVNDNVDPKEKYKDQNQKLKDMGFINDDVNIEALKKTGGNVDAAVERLLNLLN